MVRDDERGVIGLEFGKKKYKLFFIRATSRADPNSNSAHLTRAKLARVILARIKLVRV
jgi:hypothetical protein